MRRTVNQFFPLISTDNVPPLWNIRVKRLYSVQMANNESDTERRKNSRVTFRAEVVMQSGNQEWSCNLLDISLKGMLVEPPEDLDIDISKPCAVALFLGEDTAIHARVKITRVKNEAWGLEWLHIDIESLSHLRRLLELNLSDPALIERELSDLG